MCLGLLELIEQSNGTRVGEMCLCLLHSIEQSNKAQLGDCMCLGLLESIEQSNGMRVGEICLRGSTSLPTLKTILGGKKRYAATSIHTHAW